MFYFLWLYSFLLIISLRYSFSPLVDLLDDDEDDLVVNEAFGKFKLEY